ncbi:MAG: addiction module protein [Planctomycetes bacterium]|nr:addiction module protein [Planctomycetota bacterium]MCA8946508.1 addiction module protein [Planctomycetota bacterium]
MSTAIKPEELARMSAEDKLKLINVIWRSLASEASDQDWHSEVIQERLKKHRESPSEGVDADEFLDGLDSKG